MSDASPIAGTRRLLEPVDQGRLGVVAGARVAVQVAAEALVVVEPPHGGRRHHEVLGAALAQPLELGDRLVVVGRVMARIGAVVELREVPGPVALEVDESLVALADDEHRRPGGHVLADGSRHAAGERVVLRVVAPRVGLPGDAPLLLEAAAVGVEELAVAPVGGELPSDASPKWCTNTSSAQTTR